jgi:hypothetical protein
MKRTHRFDMYLAAVAAIARQGDLRMDANETAMFARQLEDIDTELYRREYPELRGTVIVPTRTNINEGAEEYTYRSIDRAGRSAIIANYGTDLPRVDIQGKEETARLFGHGASYGFSIQDLRRSRMTGMPLDNERADAAREAIALTNDTVCAFGESSIGVTGFYNNADVSLVTPITGTWLTATADQIVDDLIKMERAIMVDSNMVEMADTVVLPGGLFAIANTKRLANTETTALEFFLKKSLGVKNVEHWYHGELADAGGTGPRIAMGRRDPRKLQFLLPLPFYQMAPEQKGLGFEISCDSRVGGVIFRYPKSWRYMDGC